MLQNRIFTPYERNFLKKHNFDINKVSDPHIPVEYLVGKADFRGLSFFVNSNTLIPRMESEKLVDIALNLIQQNHTADKSLNILDLCTGSGCLGISLAYELKKLNRQFNIYLSDISKEALSVAKRNIHKILPNEKKLHLIHSDLFTNIPKINFDIIISNPPYIPTANLNNLDPSVKDFEPMLALNGGPDGTTIINQIISNLPLYQQRINTLIEVDDTFNLNKIKSEGLKPSLIKDQFGVDRFLSLFTSL